MRSIIKQFCVLPLLALSFSTPAMGSGFIGIGAVVGENGNDLRIPWRTGKDGKLFIEPTLGFTMPWEKTYIETQYSYYLDVASVRFGLGVYRSKQFGTPDPGKAKNDFGYLGPVYKAEVNPGGILSSVGLALGGEHFMMVNPRTNDYNRFSLAAEVQVLYSSLDYIGPQGESGIDINANVVARYYFGMLDLNIEVKATDELEMNNDFDDLED